MGTGSILPEWFTKEYIENVLQNHYKTEELAVKEMSAQPATKRGDNYASVMHRVSVEFVKNGKTIKDSFILKVRSIYLFVLDRLTF